MEFDLQNSRSLLPVNSFPLSLYERSLESKHENALYSACTTSSHVLGLNRMSQEYYFADGCYGRLCEVPNYDLGSKQGKFLKWVKAIHLK